VAGPAREAGGSWYGLLAVVQEARALRAQERAAERATCDCGTALKSGPNGQLYCPWDGLRY